MCFSTAGIVSESKSQFVDKRFQWFMILYVTLFRPLDLLLNYS